MITGLSASEPLASPVATMRNIDEDAHFDLPVRPMMAIDSGLRQCFLVAERRGNSNMTESSDERLGDVVPNGSIGAEFRQHRLAKGMSLADLSARTNFSRGYLSKIENGRVQITQKIARIYDDAVDGHGQLVRLVQQLQTGRLRVTTLRAVDLPPSNRLFCGRDDLLAQMLAMLKPSGEQHPRLIVLFGLPGAGKTELAVQAAGRLLDSYDNGCLFVDLHGPTEPLATTDIMSRILRRLGLPGEIIPHDPDEQTALYRRTLRDLRLLLIFDNAGSTTQVSTLIPPGGRCDVIVTSRTRLVALDEALQLRIEELDQLAARELFTRIAEIESCGGATDRQIDRAIELSGRLALAVRIAAALLRAAPELGLSGLIGQLERASRLGALDDGARSVEAAFESGFAALPPELGRALPLLALHPGDDLSDWSAASLTGMNMGVHRILDVLVDTCMLTAVRTGRVQFHDLVREYAVERVRAVPPEGESDRAVRRLLADALHIAQHADIKITPGRYRAESVLPGPASRYAKFADANAAGRWFEDEQHNLFRLCELAASAHRPDICWRLAYALRDFYFRTKRWTPWIRTHQLALVAAEACEDPWASAVTMNNLGLAMAETEQFVPAQRLYDGALQLFRRLGDRYGEANSLGHQAWVRHCLGEHRSAGDLGRAALQFYERHGMARNAAITLRTVALAEAAQHNFDVALDLLHRALNIAVDEGLVLDETMTLNCLGEVYAQTPDPANSKRYFRAAHQLGRSGGSTFEQARALRGLASAAAAAGRTDEATRLLLQAQSLHTGHRVAPRQTRRRGRGADQEIGAV